jgi:hypothetical protein
MACAQLHLSGRECKANGSQIICNLGDADPKMACTTWYDNKNKRMTMMMEHVQDGQWAVITEPTVYTNMRCNHTA